MPAIHAVLVTYERSRELGLMLEALEHRTLPLDSLLVVDNSPQQTARPLVAEAPLTVAAVVTYRATGENLGPAGALAVGMADVLAGAEDEDWILLLDDDDPPPNPEALVRLRRLGERCVAVDPSTAGVGRTGARFDASRGTVRRLRDDELRGDVPVDYLGGGHLPLYRVRNVRDAGVPDADLFFGFDDLEYGLRLRRAGGSLYVCGSDLLADRAQKERTGLGTSLASARTEELGWRDYYAHRNLVHILRAHGASRAALRRSAVVLSKQVAHLPMAPARSLRGLRWLARASWHGWRGHLGRTVEPVSP